MNAVDAVDIRTKLARVKRAIVAEYQSVFAENASCDTNYMTGCLSEVMKRAVWDGDVRRFRLDVTLVGEDPCDKRVVIDLWLVGWRSVYSITINS